MKIINSILAIFLISISIISCDKVDGPYYQEGVVTPPTTRVLLEDYTGQQCPNCPAAAVIAHDLQNIYGDSNLIVVAIHAGFFAWPDATGTYTYDFTTPAGDAYDIFVKPSAYPVGTLDRIENNSGYTFEKDDWASIISQRLYYKKTIEVEIEPIATDSIVSGEIEIEFIDPISTESWVQIWITEDHILKPQIGEGDEYEHNHVLRGAVNGIWGEKLPSTNYAAGSTETINISDYKIGDDWVMENLSIVAFVYDGATKEVIQVNKKKIIE